MKVKQNTGELKVKLIRKENKMKRKLVTFTILSIILCLSTPSFCSINNVYVNPHSPYFWESISIEVFGVEGSKPILVEDTDFRRNGTSLEFDISLYVGPWQVVTNWSYYEDIGTLPTGNYDLVVRTIEDNIVTDTHQTSFEVIPEPATLLLLAMGAFVLRQTNKIHR